MSFEEWHRKETQWIDTENQFEQWQRWRKWQEILRFFIGEQLIWWDGDLQNGYFRQVELEEGDPYYASNILQPYINALLAELFRSNGELLVAPKTDQWADVEGATIAKAGLVQEQRRIWTDDATLRSLLYLLLYGNVFWFTGWIPSSGPQISLPNMQMQPQTFGQQYAQCATCGDQSVMPPLQPGQQPPQTCQQCGSPSLVISGNNQPINMPSFGPPTKQVTGDVGLIIPGPEQIKLHLHSRHISETPYLNWNQWMLKEEAETLFEYGNFEQAGYNSREGRVIERENETHAGNMSGMGAFGHHDRQLVGTSTDSNMVLIRRYWLRPSRYWKMIPDQPIECESGLVIPAGTALREVFPNGMYLVKSGDEVLDMDAKKIDDSWVHIRYQTMPQKIWGDGLENLIQQQREYNELRSVELENAFHNATPMTLVNGKKFKNISGKARQVAYMENPGKDDKPKDFIHQPEGRSLGGDIPVLKQNIKGDMQLQSGAPVGESGIEGASTNTATGMQIVRDWTNSKLAVRLGPLNAGKIKQAEQHLKLMQQFWTGDRYIKISNESGIEDGRWFQAADISGDYDITMKPGSWQPRSAMELKDNMLQLLVAGGTPLGVFGPGFPKKPAVVLCRELGFPMDLDGYSVHVRKQRMEIDQIKQAESVGQQFGAPPGIVSAQAVPVEETDDHAAHIDAIKAYCNTDLGMKEPPPIKAAIIQHMHMHMQAQQMEAMQQMMLMSGMMPGGPPPQGGHPPQGHGSPPGHGEQHNGPPHPAANRPNGPPPSGPPM